MFLPPFLKFSTGGIVCNYFPSLLLEATEFRLHFKSSLKRSKDSIPTKKCLLDICYDYRDLKECLHFMALENRITFQWQWQFDRYCLISYFIYYISIALLELVFPSNITFTPRLFASLIYFRLHIKIVKVKKLCFWESWWWGFSMKNWYLLWFKLQPEDGKKFKYKIDIDNLDQI